MADYRMRRIVRNGNSTHVSLPQQLLDRLRWRPGDVVIVEEVDVDRISVRRARVGDLMAPGLPLEVKSPLDKVPA